MMELLLIEQLLLIEINWNILEMIEMLLIEQLLMIGIN